MTFIVLFVRSVGFLLVAGWMLGLVASVWLLVWMVRLFGCFG